MVLARNVCQASVLPQSSLTGGAAFQRGLIGGDQALLSADEANAANHTCARRLIFHPDPGQRRDLQEVRAFVQEHLHTLPRQQLPPLDVPPDVLLASTFRRALQFRSEPLHRRLHRRIVRLVDTRLPVNSGFERGHWENSVTALLTPEM